MRVAFWTLPSALQVPGGGEVQLMETRKELTRLGIDVEFFDPWTHRLKDFDILHLFGSHPSHIELARETRRQGVKVVLSPITWGAKHQCYYDIANIGTKYLRIIRARTELYQLADRLLPNTQAEADQLVRYWKQSAEKICLVHNGVDAGLAKLGSAEQFRKYFGKTDYILCVGRFERNKNQIMLAKAAQAVRKDLVLIGYPSPAEPEYIYKLRKLESEGNVTIVTNLRFGDELLFAAYKGAAVHALISERETPGLASLEAGICGTNVVTTPIGGTLEYFGALARYSLPRFRMVVTALQDSLRSPDMGRRLKDHLGSNFSWERTAKETLRAYTSILNL